MSFSFPMLSIESSFGTVLFHVKRALFHMVFNNLPYPIYNLSCLEIIPQIVYVFRLRRFRFQNPFSWFNRVFVNPSFLMMLSVAFVCTILVSHETFYHKPSVTNVNRYRIVFILVYISAVVGQQYIFVVNCSVSRETSVVHIIFLCFHLFHSFRGLILSFVLFNRFFHTNRSVLIGSDLHSPYSRSLYLLPKW